MTTASTLNKQRGDLDAALLAATGFGNSGGAMAICGSRVAWGIGAEIAMQIIEHCFDWLDAPPVRVAGLDVPLPYAANLEKAALIDPARIVATVRKVCYR